MTNANDFFGSSNGSDRFFLHRPSRITFSRGVKDLIDTCSAYWLLDLITSNQSKKRVKAERCQIWNLKRWGDDRFTIIATDASHNRLAYQYMPHCDFCYDLATFYLINGTLMLPKEY